MPSRPDIRDLATNVRDAFADADRDTLLDVLTFVVKEYVVEGPPPMLIHQAETLSDLKNMSFGQLIAALQTRFDHPELAMFVVDGEGVGVRINGVVQPLLARAAAAPANFVDTRPHAAAPPPAPGVRVVEATLAPRPPAPAPVAAPTPAPAPARPAGEAPPPNRGLSIRGRPSGGDAPAPAAAAAAPTSTAAPATPPAPAPEKPEGSGDDASARFSLLELD